jgi:thiol:disulfide interchange protein
VPLRPALFVLVLFAAVLAVVAASKLATGKERVPWRSELPAALAESRASGKPVLLYITADWCGPCQWMKSHVFTDGALADAVTQRFIPVRVDHDQRPDLVTQYGLDGVPWFGVLDADGRAIRVRDYAFETPEEMTAWIKGP